VGRAAAQLWSPTVLLVVGAVFGTMFAAGLKYSEKARVGNCGGRPTSGFG
jgi:hypothetical protein